MDEISVPVEAVKEAKERSYERLENAELILKVIAMILLIAVFILKLIQVGLIAQIVLISLSCILILVSLIINIKLSGQFFEDCMYLTILIGNLFITINTL